MGREVFRAQGACPPTQKTACRAVGQSGREELIEAGKSVCVCGGGGGGGGGDSFGDRFG
jgi:hypothetical protein